MNILHLPLLLTTAPGQKKRARSSSATITLARSHPYGLTSFEEHRYLFDQGPPLLYTTILHHEVFSTITSDRPSNFGQTLKVTDQVNWIKGEYHNMKITALLASSLTPLPMQTYPAQPASSDLF